MTNRSNDLRMKVETQNIDRIDATANSSTPLESKECKRRSEVSSEWQPHQYTSRNLADFEDMFPVFVDFTQLVDIAAANGHILEIGCGSGRALLDLKAKHPLASVFGSNYRGYGYGQIDGSEDAMWAVAEAFKIPVRCDASGRPLFPTVLGLPKVQHAMLPFPSGHFDLIFSRHSLNEGKVSACRTPCAFLRRSRIGHLILSF